MSWVSRESVEVGHLPSVSGSVSNEYGQLQTHLYELTEEDERVLEEILPVAEAAAQHAKNNGGGAPVERKRFKDATPDDLLAEHGVTWDGDRIRYHALTRALLERLK